MLIYTNNTDNTETQTEWKYLFRIMHVKHLFICQVQNITIIEIKTKTSAMTTTMATTTSITMTITIVALNTQKCVWILYIQCKEKMSLIIFCIVSISISFFFCLSSFYFAPLTMNCRRQIVHETPTTPIQQR